MNGQWCKQRPAQARQAELIKQWQPWKNSTGPTSPEGKAKASGNAWKGGIRLQLREVSKVLREQEQFLNDLL